MLPTASEMEHQSVACGVRPAINPFHDMLNSPRTVHCDLFLTDRACAVLPRPDAVELLSASHRVQHFLTPSGFEVLFPFRVVRIGVRFDLDMPLYWRVAFVKQ